jgi:hypothetical protein
MKQYNISNKNTFELHQYAISSYLTFVTLVPTGYASTVAAAAAVGASLVVASAAEHLEDAAFFRIPKDFWTAESFCFNSSFLEECLSIGEPSSLAIVEGVVGSSFALLARTTAGVAALAPSFGFFF